MTLGLPWVFQTWKEWEPFTELKCACFCTNCKFYTDRTFESLGKGDFKCNHCARNTLEIMNVERIFGQLRDKELEALLE